MGLIDEYQLLVHPIMWGAGRPLFMQMARPVSLKLLRAQTFKNGSDVLYHESERK